ncbi:ankyrin repeat domain-containing protein [Leptospira meyeri]|uniref:ankyrin repeat domain-containing protein n=1 Tax=Leptospira meyeri TaxID=29508 RepID=UPI0002BE42BE|nr:ankyrin repeat domain-containing protein [Leptospira meyeri]EMJ88078.1 ankyrin repeat protein [Leptospira meyeri serovar Semaranga str. Veldrot Semarang 173]
MIVNDGIPFIFLQMYKFTLILFFILNCASTSKPLIIEQAKVGENCKVKDGNVINPDFSVERFGVYFQGCFDKLDSNESVLSFVFSRIKGTFNVNINTNGSVRSNSNSVALVDKSNSTTSVKTNSKTLVQTFSKDFIRDNYYVYSVSYTIKNKQPHIEIRDITFSGDSAPEILILNSIKKNDLVKVKELFDTGAINKDFLVTDQNGIVTHNSNLLIQAFYLESNTEILKYLISKKVSLDSKDIFGWTPLLLAAKRNDFELFQYIYSLKKWDINDVTDQNETCLHWAVGKKNIPMIKFLLKNGANKDIKNRFGQIAKDLASNENDKEIKSLLE